LISCQCTPRCMKGQCDGGRRGVRDRGSGVGEQGLGRRGRGSGSRDRESVLRIADWKSQITDQRSPSGRG
jgi:hypothetical protein